MKDCDNCKHKEKDYNEEPCHSCAAIEDYDKWEAITNKSTKQELWNKIERKKKELLALTNEFYGLLDEYATGEKKS